MAVERQHPTAFSSIQQHPASRRSLRRAHVITSYNIVVISRIPLPFYAPANVTSRRDNAGNCGEMLLGPHGEIQVTLYSTSDNGCGEGTCKGYVRFRRTNCWLINPLGIDRWNRIARFVSPLIDRFLSITFGSPLLQLNWHRSLLMSRRNESSKLDLSSRWTRDLRHAATAEDSPNEDFIPIRI